MAKKGVRSGPTIIVRREEPEDEGSHGGSWKVAYADFVTALMALFLLLWLLMALKPQDKAALAVFFQSPEDAQNSEVGKPLIGEAASRDIVIIRSDPLKRTQLNVAGKLKELLKNTPKISQNSGLSVDDRGVALEIGTAVLFEPDSARLTWLARQMLDQVAEIFFTYKADITISGHSDSDEARGAGYDSEWELSMARAGAAMEYVADKFPDPPGRMEIRAYGDSRPQTRGDTPEARQKNRRIEIHYSFPDLELSM